MKLAALVLALTAVLWGKSKPTEKNFVFTNVNIIDVRDGSISTSPYRSHKEQPHHRDHTHRAHRGKQKYHGSQRQREVLDPRPVGYARSQRIQ